MAVVICAVFRGKDQAQTFLNIAFASCRFMPQPQVPKAFHVWATGLPTLVNFHVQITSYSRYRIYSMVIGYMVNFLLASFVNGYLVIHGLTAYFGQFFAGPTADYISDIYCTSTGDIDASKSRNGPNQFPFFFWGGKGAYPLRQGWLLSRTNK